MAATTSADHNQARLVGWDPEPAFGLASARGLRIGDRWPTARAGAALAHTIAREPLNLLAHVQRIRLWIEAGDCGETYAALLDLFVALGPRGTALRQRMLHTADPWLPRECAQFLAGVQATGFDNAKPHPPAAGSMLSRGLTGTLSLVSVVRQGAAAASDPLREADAYVAEGNIAAARSVLEAALVASPARLDLAGALLDLYRRTRDPDALRAMRAQLGVNLRGAGVWGEVERQIMHLREGVQ